VSHDAVAHPAQVWIDARARHHLSHAHVQMAHERGLNPKKLGKLDDHGQEPWKAPLREFIERLSVKRFGKRGPDSSCRDRGTSLTSSFRVAYHFGMPRASIRWTLVFTAASLEHLAERNIEAADVAAAVCGTGGYRVRRGGRGVRQRGFVMAPGEW
jgi:hypothetical protein